MKVKGLLTVPNWIVSLIKHNCCQSNRSFFNQTSAVIPLLVLHRRQLGTAIKRTSAATFIVYVAVCVRTCVFSVLRYFLLEERCRFLSNFSIATADVDIPGDYLMPKVRSEHHLQTCPTLVYYTQNRVCVCSHVHMHTRTDTHTIHILLKLHL